MKTEKNEKRRKEKNVPVVNGSPGSLPRTTHHMFRRSFQDWVTMEELDPHVST